MTEPGTERPATLLANITVPPPSFERTTVQLAVCPAASVAALHDKLLTEMGAAKDSDAAWEPPLSDAVTVAVWSDESDPAVAVNVAVVAAVGTVTDTGVDNDAPALLVKLRTPPPVVERVTVHVLVWPELKVAGLHETPLTTGAAAREIEATPVLPLKPAVIVAV